LVAIGPCCTRSVLLQRLANIPQYSPHAQSVRGYYWTNKEVHFIFNEVTMKNKTYLSTANLYPTNSDGVDLLFNHVKKEKNNYRRAIPFAGLGPYLSTCISKCQRKLRIGEESSKMHKVLFSKVRMILEKD